MAPNLKRRPLIVAERKYRSLRIGPLNVELVNQLLGCELEPADAWLSVAAHRHIAEDHQHDYPTCIQHLAATIMEPTYIGQAPQHSDNFEMIRRVPGSIVLVAVGLELNSFGNYNIRSSYLLDQDDIDYRREQRRVFLALKR